MYVNTACVERLWRRSATQEEGEEAMASIFILFIAKSSKWSTLKKKHRDNKYCSWAVINKMFINKECTLPATSVFKNNQKKIMYGHSSQLSSQKLLWL